MENINITGSADISLFGETRDDLIKDKIFDGGSMTITNRAPFSVDASVYEEDDDAYTNTEGNSERLWEVRPEDEEVYLGTLTYTNDFLEPIDFGETAVGSIIDITLDTPAQGELRGNGNFFLDIDQEREGAETLEVGFRGLDPNNFEFISTDGETTGVIPYRFDFLGGRITGSDEEIDPSFTFTVEDNSTVSIDLYGRVFALDNGDLPVNDGGDSGSEGNTPIDTGEDEPDAEIEDEGTDSGVGEDDGSDTDTPVDTDIDTPDTEEGVEDGIDSEPDDTTTDEGADDTTAGDDNPTVDDSPDETPTPDDSTDSDVGEGDDTDTPVDTDESDAEDDGGTDSEPDDTTPGEDNPVTEGESELTIDLIDTQPVSPSESTDAATSVVTVSGSGIPNQEVELAVITFDPDAFSDILTTTADAEGNWSIEIPEPLIDGEYTLIATQFELDRSDLLTDQEILNLDSSPSDIAVEITSISEDTGEDDNDFKTTDETLVFNGTAEAGSEVEVFVDGESIGTTSADAEGNWSFDHTDFEFAEDEEYELTAKVTNQDGGVGETDSTTLLEVEADFDIEFVLPQGIDPALEAQIEEAGQFWEDVIIGDLPDVGEVDDLELTISIENLGDNELGNAKPVAFRGDGNRLPYSGQFRINNGFLNSNPPPGEVLDTIKHEIGHALGLHKDYLLSYGRDLLTGITFLPSSNLTFVRSNLAFTGQNAVNAYRSFTGDQMATSVPMEFEGNARLDSIGDIPAVTFEPILEAIGILPSGFATVGHWDEDDLGDEIMTPRLNNRPVFLSPITIGAFEDMGYEVS